MKILIYYTLLSLMLLILLTLMSCSTDGRMSRVYFVEKLLEYPMDINSILDTSQYNCSLYIKPQYIQDFTKNQYYFYSDETYYIVGHEEFKDGKWVNLDISVPIHDISITSNTVPAKYYTFHFVFKDNIWCLTGIGPHKIQNHYEDVE